MRKTSLSENLSLSVIAQGFWRLTSWEFTTEELDSFMNGCIDRGVTTFDTAEVYGGTRCESLMGEAFSKDPSIRGKIELVTKTGISRTMIDEKPFGYYDTTYDRIIKSCKESLQRLQTDYIDLYLIHREDPLLDPWETGRALLDLKKEGLEQIKLPDSVQEIGMGVFLECTALKSVHFPPALRRIETNAFHGCTALLSVEVPAGTVIADGAFPPQTSITQISD